MLLIIEKVIILKSVDIFSTTAEEDLVELASLIEILDVPAGKEIIRRGELGTSLYVIVEGRARVHVGDRVLAELGERQVFGELAALDPEPRSADVTAIVDTTLFRVDEHMLLDVMSEHVEMARSIIRVLCRRLRSAAQKPA